MNLDSRNTGSPTVDEQREIFMNVVATGSLSDLKHLKETLEMDLMSLKAKKMSVQGKIEDTNNRLNTLRKHFATFDYLEEIKGKQILMLNLKIGEINAQIKRKNREDTLLEKKIFQQVWRDNAKKILDEKTFNLITAMTKEMLDDELSEQLS